jgi:TonB family protein
MAFEAFLQQTHARPPLATAFGYVASLALHAPPVAFLFTAWLSQSLIIGTTGELARPQHQRPAYHIPMSMMTASQAAQVLGNGAGAGGGSAALAKTDPHQHSRRGRAGRSGRRGLVSPRNVQKVPIDRVAAETYAFLDSLGTDSAGPPGNGDGDDSGRGDATGSGVGHGSDGTGAGGGGLDYAGGPGVNSLAASSPTMGAALAETAAAKRNQPRSHGSGRGEHADPFEDEQEVEAPPAPGRPMKASYISEESAAYFRTDSTYPSLPDSYWDNTVREYPVTLEICVSEEGRVSNVTVTRRAGNDDIDNLVCSAVKSWRYRPRMVAGVARPFCHPIVIRYSRQLRFFSR